MISLFGACWASGAASELSDFGTRVRTAVTPILAAQAQLHNTSFSLGLAHGRGAAEGEVVAIAAGVQDHRTGTRVSANDTYPIGSANKPLTAVALVALDEAGVLSLDAPAHEIIDPFLLSRNGTTLLELFGNDSRILGVTGRHLISMRAGLYDYAYTLNEAWSLDPANNGKDLTPWDYMRNADMWRREMWYTPGQGGAYSSMGFVLAGFLLAAAANASDWENYDMRTAWLGSATLSAASKARLNAGLTFPRGACSANPRVVRQYYHALTKINTTHTGVHVHDMSDESCLNGWTMGNLAATPGAAAAFLYHWLVADTDVLLPAARVAEMKRMKKMTTGYYPGEFYGLGLQVDSFFASANVSANLTYFLGHGGEDYGSQAKLNHCNPELGVCVTIATNSRAGLNCSHPDVPGLNPRDRALDATEKTGCLVWNAVLAVATNGTAGELDCGSADAARSTEHQYICI